ncbi:MATE family efflux transporter [Gilvimarinus sp. SDUM040013]|uniref:MATE family efflux transporter n=1 Tax=Gilvimarinus gilvus TaxID=3058038 RepID=A0ABU4RSW8_9GAMM|nr:MATE family efflux transporter [Gilvimarinus sp. SDUM040013]MDO3388431.1 MATE family efflux transporter [Gilvimarinus sp. SDUM040013]MDX6847981.1 MATE family efflux transporter [Gilvimarinus sp. SDUM040013]
MPPLQATMTEGHVPTQLRTLALPMVWGLMATMSFNVVDTFFVAQLGNSQLAAMSFTFPVVMVLTSIGIGLGAGTSSAVARLLGAGNASSAQRLATDAVSLTLLISVSVCVLGWFTIDPLFTLLGAPRELIPLIQQYMSIWYFSAPCLLVPMVALASLRAMGMSQIQGVLMSVAAFVNAVLDPLLIFGLFGFPELGIAGAAWATLITRACTLLVALYILKVRVGLLGSLIAPLSVIDASWRTIVHVGLPAMASNIIIPLASGVVVIMVASFGTDAVAGLGVAVRIEPLALIAFYALSGVVGPFFGQNDGAGQHHRMKEALRAITIFCVGFGALLTGLMWVFGGYIVGLFSEHRQVLEVAVLYLSIVPVSYGLYGLVMSVNAAFNGLGLPWPAMLLSACRVILVFLPLALLLRYFWGLSGLFIATATTNAMVGIWAYNWLRVRIDQASGVAKVT